MLAQLSQISGVQGTFANGSGTLVQLALAPGADPGRVILEASRSLQAQVGDRVAVPLGAKDAAAALRTEEWQDENTLAKSAGAKGSGGEGSGVPATETLPAASRSGRGVWLALLLVLGVAAALGLVWRRRAVLNRDPIVPSRAK